MSKAYTRDGGYIYFGSYPQTRAERVKFLCRKGKYFLGIDGERYARVNQSFFKVEPIRWRILTESNGAALLLSECVLDKKSYYYGINTYSLYELDPGKYLMKILKDEEITDDRPSGSSYAFSDIRLWLKSKFFQRAFSDEERKIILKTEVDNSERSTGIIPNANCCENTFDKVFLLSFDEAFVSYGLTDADRRKRATDYVREVGAFKKDFPPACNWWLRSPYPTGREYARNVKYTGEIDFERYVPETSGIVPAVWIKL